ncbi:unnamed protein product [Arctogadus glacialis]
MLNVAPHSSPFIVEVLHNCYVCFVCLCSNARYSTSCLEEDRKRGVFPRVPPPFHGHMRRSQLDLGRGGPSYRQVQQANCGQQANHVVNRLTAWSTRLTGHQANRLTAWYCPHGKKRSRCS